MPEGDTVYPRRAAPERGARRGTRSPASSCACRRRATADLRGETVHEVVARGKHLLHRIGEQHAALAPQDGGRVARLPPRRAVAQAGLQGPRDRRHRRRARRVGFDLADDRGRPHPRRGAPRRPPRARPARRRLGSRRGRPPRSPPTSAPCTSRSRTSATSPGSATSTRTSSCSSAASFPRHRRARRMPRPSSTSAPA